MVLGKLINAFPTAIFIATFHFHALSLLRFELVLWSSLNEGANWFQGRERRPYFSKILNKLRLRSLRLLPFL